MCVFTVADVNECLSTPCSNGGVCTNNIGSFSCNCTGTGFEGLTCDNGEYQSLTKFLLLYFFTLY